MAVKKVLVIFKTHLDVGFTDLAKPVIQNYMDTFLVSSVRLAAQLKKSGSRAQYKWSVGSWLIHEYLRLHPGPEGEEVRQGLKDGGITWHGLPFTTHTEMMSPALFEYGLSLSRELDQRFGKTTISAKMTDVPGHTRAMIPYLKKAGIEFLHIGVNPTSAVPKVPELFRWKAPNGDMLNVMYQGEYGSLVELPGTDVAVNVCLTNDNCGVHGPEAVEAIFDDLQEKYPEAEILAADLDDVAREIRHIQDQLPVVEEEIGDTWIHGTGTDPLRVAWFRTLSRFWETLPEGEDKRTLARGLIMIPEHTWGLNVHRFLADHDHYDREEFQEIRKIAPNYKRMESSWAEQRAFLTDAVAQLSQPVRQEAERLLAQTQRAPWMKGVDPEVAPGTVLKLGSWEIRFNELGEIDYLRSGDRVAADEKHPLMSLMYEQFCFGDYTRFFRQYCRKDELWCHEDFTKPGMSGGSSCHSRFVPETVGVYQVPDGLLVRYAFPREAHRKMGCPLLMDLHLTAADDRTVDFDLAWFCKPATRVAEALWVGFQPRAAHKRIRKIGEPVDPGLVVEDGQCRLHGTDYGVLYDGLEIESLDCGLVAPQEPSLLNFTNAKPLDSDGVWFNLYNNIWGTNFTMWYDEDARFRFRLHLK